MERPLRTKILATFFFLAWGMVLFPSAASAAGNPGVKAARGIVNLSTGWLEIPAQMAERKGFFHGVTMATTRTLYGLWDMLTFPAAPYDSPVMDPDTLIYPKNEPRDIQPLPKNKPADQSSETT